MNMKIPEDICDGFVPQPCISYTNCTESGFIANWTEFCCQPQPVKRTQYWMLTIIGTVGIVGTLCNIITISTFMYLYFFPERIRMKFGQEFSMTKDPVFFLILHLSFCDLLYCVSGLPTYWDVYYNGYYPHSEEMCKYAAFFRNMLAYADFNTLAAISAYFAWRRGRGMPQNVKHGWQPVLCIIASIWVFCFCLTSIPLSGTCGQFGYDAVHGKCHIIECEKCSEDSQHICPPGGVILAIGVGVPSLIMIISYSLVYKSLKQANAETLEQRKAVLILTLCYFIFIFPISIIEWLSDKVASRAFISVFVYSWYWLIYIINFFIYIIFWRRVRKGIILMMRDALEILGCKRPTDGGPDDHDAHSDPWWIEMRACDLFDNNKSLKTNT